MDFSTWLVTWLKRHPLNEPWSLDRDRYTAQVMARVRASAQHPSRAPASIPVFEWFSWPRLAFAGAAVGAAAMFWIVGTVHQSQTQLARAIDRDAQLLTAFDEPLPATDRGSVDELAQDLQEADTVMLAESTPSDDQWVEQTIQLLDQLNEEPPDADTTGSSNQNQEEWLNELQTLDESELAQHS